MKSFPTHSSTLRIACALLWFLATLSIATNSGAEEWSFAGPTMGTSYSVKLVAPNDETSNAESIDQAIRQALDDVNQAMSTYLEDSEVSRFNASTSTDWFTVSESTFRVVASGQELSKRSEGAFDITVGPLVNRWSFGPDKSIKSRPTQEETESLLENVGYQALELRESPPAIRKSKPELAIDLSAIAKGFAVDQVAAAIEDLGVSSYLIEVGGEVRCLGVKDNGNPWTTGIRRPIQGGQAVLAAVRIGDQSIATSGDYENFIVLEGEMFSHTIDPKTGLPIRNGLTSVSVVAPDCMTADGLATAVSVLGYTKGKELVESYGGKLYTIQRVGEAFEENWTNTFPFVDEPKPVEQSSLMGTIIAGVVVFAIALLAMSVGVIFSNRRIQGSCGGLASMKQGHMSPECSACGQKTDECKELQEAIKNKSDQAEAST